MSEKNPRAPIVEVTNLSKSFAKLQAVNSVSFEIKEGEIFGFLGPNGAGKTTFVKLLLSCAHPTAGTARVFGRNAILPDARRSIGYLPENHRFPTYMTGRSMLDFYGALSGMDSPARQKRIPELLSTVGLADWGNVRLGKYSKGMLQRVGLAQALMHSPSLLILDEPTDGVDPIGRIQIRELLHTLEQQGVTIFLNSHLLSEVELFCRDVAIIHRGRVALEGKVKDLTAGSGYRVEAAGVPEKLRDALRAKARTVAERNGNIEFIFAGRDEANQAVDLLRSERCEIETLARATSTLEEVFVKVIHER